MTEWICVCGVYGNFNENLIDKFSSIFVAFWWENENWKWSHDENEETGISLCFYQMVDLDRTESEKEFQKYEIREPC